MFGLARVINKPPWYVYILKCADSTLYTGITIDVTRRVDEHNYNNKLAAKYTRVRRPVKLVYQEKLKSRSLATKREKAIKKLKREDKKALLS